MFIKSQCGEQKKIREKKKKTDFLNRSSRRLIIQMMSEITNIKKKVLQDFFFFGGSGGGQRKSVLQHRNILLFFSNLPFSLFPNNKIYVKRSQFWIFGYCKEENDTVKSRLHSTSEDGLKPCQRRVKLCNAIYISVDGLKKNQQLGKFPPPKKKVHLASRVETRLLPRIPFW